MRIATEELLALIDLVSQERIADLHLTKNGVQIHIQLHGEATHTPVQTTTPAATATTPTPTPAQNPATSTSPVAAERMLVKAPMAGTFYRASSTAAPPLVQVGQQVAAHTSLGILEAMKMMNDIATHGAGTVVRILVEDGQTVDAGQVLFELEATR